MKKTQKYCLTAALLMGMMFLAAIFTLQGALLTSLITHYSVAESVQGFASSTASIGGVVALVSSFFLIGKLSKLLLLRCDARKFHVCHYGNDAGGLPGPGRCAANDRCPGRCI